MSWQLFVKKKGERKYHLDERPAMSDRHKAEAEATKLRAAGHKAMLGWHPEPPAKGGKK